MKDATGEEKVNREPPPVTPEERNTLEWIRFANEDDERLATRALLDRCMMNASFSASRPGIWSVMTPIPRKLRELDIPFEWLTEHV